MFVTIEKRPRKSGNSYRVIQHLGKGDGGPRSVLIGTFHHRRGEGGAEDARDQAIRDWSTARGFAADISIRSLGDFWLANIAAVGVQDTTFAHYKKALKDHIYPSLGDTLLCDFGIEGAATWQADQLMNGRVGGGPLSPKSVRNYRGILHEMLEWAVDSGKIASNPFSKLDPPKLQRRKLLPPDIRSLQRYADAVKDTRYYRPLMLGNTAMRRGEIMALRYCDIEGGFINCARQLVQIGSRVVLHDHTKTPAGMRRIPIPVYLQELLKVWRREDAALCLQNGESFTDEMRVCHAIAKPDDLTHGLRKLFHLRHLKPLHIHLVRHAVATDLVRRGVDPSAVQRLLGHKHISTTLGTYHHTNDDDVKAAMGQWEEAWKAADEAQRSREHSQNLPKTGKVVEIGGRRRVKIPAKDGDGA